MKIHHHRKTLALSLGLAIAGASLPASATVSFATTASAIASSGFNSASDSSGAAAPSASASAGVVSYNFSSFAQSDITGYQIGSLGSLNGSGLNRQFSTSAQISNFWTISNTSGTAANYTSSFIVYNGYLSVREGVGTDYAMVRFGFNLVDVATSALLANGLAELDSLGHLNQTGILLNALPQTYSFETHELQWNATTFSINLGTLQPGQNKVLRYDMFASASADYTNTPLNYCPTIDADCWTPRAWANSMDPGTFAGLPILSVSSSPANSIPIPGSLLLLGTSLSLLAMRRRRTSQG